MIGLQNASISNSGQLSEACPWTDLSAPREQTFFVPEANCWRIARADRLSVLIDAHAYYLAVLDAITQARQTIFILGWDIDSRVVLKQDEIGQVTLGQALRSALERNPNLTISILCWDFAMIYSLERQLFPQFQRAFRHPRIQFVLDGKHPFGASHHQKAVVIDDQLAFLGGLDLCSHRWDTRMHWAFDSRRKGIDGKPYHPFHDLQVAVDGQAARAIGELFRSRWRNATGQDIPPPAVPIRPAPRIWPEGAEALATDIDVALARTYPQGAHEPPVCEVEQLFLDSIARAERYLYIDNQYFTSERIASAIRQRLGEPNGPEVLLVVPRFNAGWMEQYSMGVLRSRILRQLMANDPYRRLRVYYPAVQSVSGEIPVSLHSKMMIIDDWLLHTGSANLSNRSMGLDSECDLAIEGPRARPVVEHVRNSLLAEFLDVSEGQVTAAIGETGSLFAALDRLRAIPNRRADLKPFDPSISPWVDLLTPDSSILDPHRPIEEDPYFSNFLPRDRDHFVRLKNRKLVNRMLFGVVAAVLLGRARRRVDADVLAAIGRLREAVDQNHPGALSFLYSFASSLAGIPADLVIFGWCLARRPRYAAWESWLGLLGVTLTCYLAGRTERSWMESTGRQPERPQGSGQGGFWTGFLLHANLVGYYPRISYLSGCLRSPLMRYASGTMFGQTLRIGAVTAYATSWERAVRKPGWLSLGMLIGTTLGVLGVFRWSSVRLLPVYGRASAERKFSRVILHRARRSAPFI